jgi:hypothetical protein
MLDFRPSGKRILNPHILLKAAAPAWWRAVRKADSTASRSVRPPSGVVQRYGRAGDLLPGPLPDGSQQPFFFLLRPAPTFLRDRAQSTDPVVESD